MPLVLSTPVGSSASIGPGGIEIEAALVGRVVAHGPQSDQEELKDYVIIDCPPSFIEPQSDQEELKLVPQVAEAIARAMPQSDQEELKWVSVCGNH